jgi:hypothetical protein
MDILITLRDFVIDIIFSLPEGVTSIILRIGLLLALSTILLYGVWIYIPWRTVFSQTSVAFIAVVIAVYSPVEQLRSSGKEVLAFWVIFALLCMVFLPGRIAFLLTPRLGNQLKLKKGIVFFIWGALFVQLLIGG